VTLHLVEVEDARAFGCVPTDAVGRVTAFLEKMPDPVTRWINAGAYVMRRGLIDEIPTDRAVSVERETFPGLLDAGATVQSWRETAYWRDLGTPAAYVAGSCDVVLGRVSGAVSAASPVAGAVVLPGADVAPSAVLGDGTTVGAGAVVGPAAQVLGSVLLDGAVIEAGARVCDSVVGAAARVAAGCQVVDAVVGAGSTVAQGNELRAGARLWPGVDLPETALRFSSDG
jgi:mannose-1-phosphate guanylyltransferase